MSPKDKPLVWLHGRIKSPPLSKAARLEAGFLLRRLQRGEKLAMPHARPMPVIAAHCYELRVVDTTLNWRVICRIDADAIVIAEVFAKKTQTTPPALIALCQRRLKEYDDASSKAQDPGKPRVEDRGRQGSPGARRRRGSIH